jgi:hypothetical protein
MECLLPPHYVFFCFLQSQEAKLAQRRQRLDSELAQAKHAESAAAEAARTAAQQRQRLGAQQAALRAKYQAAAGKLQGGKQLLRARAELEALQGQLEKVSCWEGMQWVGESSAMPRFIWGET